MSAMTDKELAEEVARVWVNGGGEGSKRMTGDIQIMMSSRRTIMDGEVVTFATSFNRRDGVFGAVYEAEGPFRVSASRDAVVVHRASCASKQESAALLEAIICAESVRTALAPHQSGGRPSLFPEEPTVTVIRLPAARTGTHDPAVAETERLMRMWK